jgi:hypothetical protein
MGAGAALVAGAGYAYYDAFLDARLRGGFPDLWPRPPMEVSRYDALTFGVLYVFMSLIVGLVLYVPVALLSGVVEGRVLRRGNRHVISLVLSFAVFFLAGALDWPPAHGGGPSWLRVGPFAGAWIWGAAHLVPAAALLHWGWDLRSRSGGNEARLALWSLSGVLVVFSVSIFLMAPHEMGVAEAQEERCPMVTIYAATTPGTRSAPAAPSQSAVSLRGYIMAETQDEWYVRLSGGGACILRKSAVDRIDLVPGRSATPAEMDMLDKASAASLAPPPRAAP